MIGMINNINYIDLEVQKYWSFPKSYKHDKKAETKNMIFGNNYIGSRKMDGAFYKFIKDDEGNMRLQGRSKSVSGEYLDKIGHVPQLHSFFNSLPCGTCLLGEIYFPKNEGSKNVTTIMGCKEPKAIERQKTGDKLHYYVFDVLAWKGESYYTKDIESRVQLLNQIHENYSSFEYIDWAYYCDGKELWNRLDSILGEGGEGVVITKKGTAYQPGKRPARQTLKIKKEITDTIDCFFTGKATAPTKEYTGKEIENWTYWLNHKTGEKIQGRLFDQYQAGAPITPITQSYYNGWAGSLQIGLIKNNTIEPIGYISGLSNEVKANYKNYKHKVVEVSCMEIDDQSNSLRHAKVLRFRADDEKKWTECLWSDYFDK